MRTKQGAMKNGPGGVAYHVSCPVPGLNLRSGTVFWGWGLLVGKLEVWHGRSGVVVVRHECVAGKGEVLAEPDVQVKNGRLEGAEARGSRLVCGYRESIL